MLPWFTECQSTPKQMRDLSLLIESCNLCLRKRPGECKGWGQRACKRASKMTSCMDNRGRQRKSLPKSLRGKIHSHDDLEISLILGTGQPKQKSRRLKPGFLTLYSVLLFVSSLQCTRDRQYPHTNPETKSENHRKEENTALGSHW